MKALCDRIVPLLLGILALTAAALLVMALLLSIREGPTVAPYEGADLVVGGARN